VKKTVGDNRPAPVITPRVGAGVACRFTSQNGHSV
jgi:hypothetical protein